MTKIIITCALTGSIHTPSMSPYLPTTPEQIVNQGIDAANAGASILHLHARDQVDGRPSSKLTDYTSFLPELHGATSAILNLSTGGSALMTLEDRLEASLKFHPEMCSLNMGTMNFALYPMIKKDQIWLHDWELKFLQESDDLVFKNTPRDIEFILNNLGHNITTKFEFECYDTGHLYMLKHFQQRGLVQGDIFIQFVFGVLGGIAADPKNLIHLKSIADELFGENYNFSVLAAGRNQVQMAIQAASMGGHVRVGLEDNLYIRKGELARSNAQQVENLRKIVEELGREVATPEETRLILGLKGKENTDLSVSIKN